MTKTKFIEKINIKKMCSKKAQITIFVLLGILMLGGAMTMLYLKSAKTITSPKITSNANDVKIFVESCLKSSLKKNLFLIGKQGGVIYDSQGGLFLDYTDGEKGQFYIESEGMKTNYLITRPFGSNGFYFSTSPKYPWENFPNANGEKIFTGFFGLSKLPPLYKLNYYSNTDQLFSIEEELSSVITKDIENCNLVSLKNYDIKKDNPEVELLFTNGAVIANLNYTLNIKTANSDQSIVLSDFKASIPLNFKKIYFFTEYIIKQEIQNISFSLANISSDYDVFLIRNKSNYDDLVVIQDRASIESEKYRFIFGRKNRMPALTLIDISNQTITNTTIIDRNFLKFEVIDPDEDDLLISYILNDGSKINLPYQITQADCNNPSFSLTINVSDGQFSDYQRLSRGASKKESVLNFRC